MYPQPPGYFTAAKKRMRQGMHPSLIAARNRFNSPDPAGPMVQRQQPPPQSTAPDWGNVRYNGVADNPRMGMDYREKQLPDGNVLHDYPGTANDVVVRPHTRRLPGAAPATVRPMGGNAGLQLALALLMDAQKKRR